MVYLSSFNKVGSRSLRLVGEKTSKFDGWRNSRLPIIMAVP